MLARAVDDLADLVLARTCAACGVPGRAVCPSCASEVLALAVGFGGPRPVRPAPCPPGLPWTVAAGPYAGALACLVGAHKDEGRRDVRPVLATLLAGALGMSLLRALSDTGVDDRAPRAPLLVVPAPGSAAARRRRGADPVGDLVAAALRQVRPTLPDTHPPPVLVRALRHSRSVRDQAGLAAGARRENLHEAVGLRRGVEVTGRRCLLVDDVVTTGATLAECARALADAGAVVAGAAAVCATSRRGYAQASRLSRPGRVG